MTEIYSKPETDAIYRCILVEPTTTEDGPAYNVHLKIGNQKFCVTKYAFDTDEEAQWYAGALHRALKSLLATLPIPAQPTLTRDTICDAIMGAAKLHTHDHLTALKIAEDALSTLAALCAVPPQESASPQKEKGRWVSVEQLLALRGNAADIAAPWPAIGPPETEVDKAVVEVRTKIAAAIRAIDIPIPLITDRPHSQEETTPSTKEPK